MHASDQISLSNVAGESTEVVTRLDMISGAHTAAGVQDGRGGWPDIAARISSVCWTQTRDVDGNVLVADRYQDL